MSAFLPPSVDCRLISDVSHGGTHCQKRRTIHGSQDLGNDGHGRKSNDLLQIEKRPFEELQEDIDDAFKHNMVLFERRPEMQNK